MDRRQTDHQPAELRASHWPWMLFSLCALTAIALFFIPTFIIRPFRYQAPRALLLAMVLRQRLAQLSS